MSTFLSHEESNYTLHCTVLLCSNGVALIQNYFVATFKVAKLFRLLILKLFFVIGPDFSIELKIHCSNNY